MRLSVHSVQMPGTYAVCHAAIIASSADLWSCFLSRKPFPSLPLSREIGNQLVKTAHRAKTPSRLRPDVIFFVYFWSYAFLADCGLGPPRSSPKSQFPPTKHEPSTKTEIQWAAGRLLRRAWGCDPTIGLCLSAYIPWLLPPV